MSAYLDASCYYARAHFQRPMAAGPLTAYSEDGESEFDSDLEDFVSEDDVVERDIDAEIEEREQLERERLERISQERHEQQAPPVGRTISQRMLQSLQHNRGRGRTVAASTPAPAPVSAPARMRTSTTVKVPRQWPPLDDVSVDLECMGYDDFEESSVAATAPITEAFATPPLGTSCTDRLEARISKTFLKRRDHSDKAVAHAQEALDVSTLYSGRRTYPAESLRKSDHARLSDNPADSPAPTETKMMQILAKERAERVFQTRVSGPEVEKAKQSSGEGGVRFHFKRGSSLDSELMTQRMDSLALTSRRYPTAAPPTALVRAHSTGRMENHGEHAALARQLGDIETLIDGIEHCMSTPSFLPLATRVLRELALLSTSAQQIRTSGTTLILADVAQQQTETTQALRRLVTRAAAVQNHIAMLSEAVKKLTV